MTGKEKEKFKNASNDQMLVLLAERSSVVSDIVNNISDKMDSGFKESNEQITNLRIAVGKLQVRMYFITSGIAVIVSIIISFLKII